MLEHKCRAKGIMEFLLVLCQQEETIIIIITKFAKEAILFQIFFADLKLCLNIQIFGKLTYYTSCH